MSLETEKVTSHLNLDQNVILRNKNRDISGEKNPLNPVQGQRPSCK
jgi:hypothetical protein